MKTIRHVFLGTLGLSVVLILATGCFRPAAPDVSPISPEGAEAATPGESELEATAIANTTRAAQRAATQTADAEAAGEDEVPAETSTEAPAATSTEAPAATSTEAPAETGTEPAATATTEPAIPTATPMVSAATPVPTPLPTPTVPPSGEMTYVVQPGDNLFRIALRFGTSVEAITQANGIANARQIYVGQRLIIPSGGQPAQPPAGGTTYVVRPGDNLFRIALRYNMSYQRLAEYNGIVNPSSIYVGQVIRIPPQ